MYTHSPPEKYFLIHRQSCSVDVGISPHTPSNHGPYAPGRRESEKQMCNIFHFITKLTHRIHNEALIDDLTKKREYPNFSFQTSYHCYLLYAHGRCLRLPGVMRCQRKQTSSWISSGLSPGVFSNTKFGGSQYLPCLS
jgi:hypothetical protein